MVTMAQRMEALRTARGLNRPALASALGFPRMAVEKFESGRQTPSQEQQQKLAAFFGVSLTYLRGETDDPTDMDSWLGGSFTEAEPKPMAKPAPAWQDAPAKAAPKPQEGAVFGALLKSDAFRTLVRQAALEALQTPEGQALLEKAVRKELQKRQ